MHNLQSTDLPYYVLEPLRLEYRSTQPYKRKDLERALEVIKNLGIGAWWIGVMGTEGALFKSSIMLVHPELKDDVIPWLSEECDRAGVVLITHYSFEPGGSYNRPLLRQHPEWKMQFLKNENGEEPSFEEWPNICPKSPYTELLEEFIKEVIGRLGLKGFWFDSAPMASGKWVGCCCPSCAERFKNETGYTMPEQINWDSIDFRKFVDWRYEQTAEIWRRMAQAVQKTNPKSCIAINTYRRLGPANGWYTGSCLQQLNFPVIVGGEDDWRCQQALLQIKYHRAMSNKYPPEVWQGLYSMPDPVALPNPEPEGRFLHQALACMTAGGFPSYGTGCHPALVKDTLSTLCNWIKPRSHWVGGEPMRYAGIVLSRHTQDFSQNGNSDKSWDSVHGMHELLNQLHLPSEVLLDEHLDLKHLSKYPLVVLPEVTCLNDNAITDIEKYVNSGGYLLVTGKTGNLNLFGESRKRSVLDELLGISSREQAEEHPVLIPGPRISKGLPEMYAVFGEPCNKVRASADSKALAHFSWLTIPPESETDWTERNKEYDSDAIIVRNSGKGHTVYFAWDIGGGFIGAARKRTRLLMSNVLAEGPTSPYRIQAPPSLVVTAWQWSDGRIVFHLLQAQGTIARFPEKLHYTVLEDTPPVENVKISLENRQISRAWMPLIGLELSLSRDMGIVTVAVPRIDRHEIVVFMR